MIPPVANRFVAGEDRQEALERAAVLNVRGIRAILNLLGETYSDPATARADVADYHGLIEEIATAELAACIAVKPTQLGLSIRRSLFEDHLEELVAHGVDRDVFVWIDMEGSATTNDTLAVFEEIAPSYPAMTGVCLQSNLRRTDEDIDRLQDVPGLIRLVKGAYNEPSSIAYRDKARIDEAYRRHLETLFRNRSYEIAVATHDPEMIRHAMQLHEVHGTPFQFQLLMGVSEARQSELAEDYEVYQYVPYGGRWFSYFTRRMLERSENLRFAVRAILGR